MTSTYDEYSQFRHFLEQISGIELGDNRAYLVTNRLQSLMSSLAVNSLAELVHQMKSLQGGRQLQEVVIDAMTTNETQWFRDTHPFSLLSKIILPDFTQKNINRARVWSAACSSGQEPYSIAMIADEYNQQSKQPCHLEITGTDISSRVLTEARQGRYEQYHMSRGLTEHRRNTYFTRNMNNSWEISSQLKVHITFKELNLLSNFNPLGRFHIIFCRNVLIYFSQQRKEDILRRMADTLEPGGYLILGASELAPANIQNLQMIRHPEGILYQLKQD